MGGLNFLEQKKKFLEGKKLVFLKKKMKKKIWKNFGKNFFFDFFFRFTHRKIQVFGAHPGQKKIFFGGKKISFFDKTMKKKILEKFRKKIFFDFFFDFFSNFFELIQGKYFF